MGQNIIKAELSSGNKNKINKSNIPVSDDAMAKLAQIMTNTPSIIKFAGTEWELKALKPGVQWKIAQIACSIVHKENATMGDIFKDLANNIPEVAKIITLALLNDKGKIENKEVFDSVYDIVLWEGNIKDYATILYEILNLQDVSFFFQTREVIEIFRKTTLEKKTMMTKAQK
ncbi:MAG: hypothetical protein ACI35S_06745 [Anaeroplasma sp.]